MTSVAGGREIQRRVVGIGGSLVILQVTGHAGRAVQRVVVVDVTVGASARRHGVHASQLEASCVVIKRRVHPVGRVVTGLAGLREVRTGVVWSRGVLKILQVAGYAGRAVQSVIAVDVAIRAGTRRHRVQTGQSESGGGVIELAIGPLHGVMALLAGGGESGMRQRRRRVVEISLVTADARHGGQVVVVVDVAIGAFARRYGMAAGEKESGGGVVELRIQPVVGGVAGVALSRELGRHVVGIDGRGEVRLVAGEALRRHGLEPTVGATLVTSIAVDSGVSSGQRETIVVILDVLVGDLPSAHGMTLFAIGTQLAAVNIGVAILAAFTDIGENHFDVTLGARDGGVQATQRIPGLIVIELGNRADGPPCGCGMAVLTGDCKIAVRAARASSSLRSRNSRKCGKREN